MNTISKKPSTSVALLASSFFFALLAMTVAREFVIPQFIPQSVGGHIPGDPTYYLDLAKAQAQSIAQNGLSAFQSHPRGQGPAGVASLLLLLHDNIYSIVILNAALHAISCLMFFLIFRLFFPTVISIIATLPVLLSPNMMFWFSQINKDSFVLTGSSIFLFFIAKTLFSLESFQYRKSYIFALSALIGAFLIWVARPYINQLLAMICLLVFSGYLARLLIVKAQRRGAMATHTLVLTFLLMVPLVWWSTGAASDQTIDSLRNSAPVHSQSEGTRTIAGECFSNLGDNVWQDIPYAPFFVNSNLRALMGQRCLTFLVLQTHDNPTTHFSVVDQNFLPTSSVDAILYAPRAAFIGLFLPHPSSILYATQVRPSIFYTIAPLESLLMYFSVASILVWLFRSQHSLALVPIIFALGPITLLAMSTPLIGALYRYRYPWWMFLIGLGLAAAIDLFKRWRASRPT